MSRSALGVSRHCLAGMVIAAMVAAIALTACPRAEAQLPSLDLIKNNGYQWLAYLSPDLQGNEDFSAPAADESKFIPWNVTPSNLDWTVDLLTARGIANGDMHGWLRLHITLPAGWGQRYKGPLRLYGFNFNASDETFFNGTSIGKTGVNPPGKDRTGLVRDADTIRNYTIPENLVNWTGDNVIAIHGYHDGGTGAFTKGFPKLAPTVDAGPGAINTGLQGTVTMDGNPASGISVRITDANGNLADVASTDADGKFLSALAPGTYKVEPQVSADYGKPSASVTIETGKIATVPSFALAKLPSIDLIKENGYQWLAYLSKEIDGGANFADPGADESKFVPWNVTASNGNWTADLLDAKGIPNGDMHGWLRLHITLPADWATKYWGPLRLYGFNFNASDETFFNGTSIGKTGVNPPGNDRTGFVRDADSIRNYIVPLEIINWYGDNVIAIHGFHDGGTGAFTNARPKLGPTVAGPRVIIRGDMDGNGKVTIADVVMALRVICGLQKATPEQLSAADLDSDGVISLGEAVKMLKAAAGLIQL